MLWAIISDIHANLQAFDAVLTDIAAQKVDRTICLGDAVGYGPQPAEVLSLLHAHVHHMLMGNHDAAVAGLAETFGFNEGALRMVHWTRAQLNETAVRFLSSLPYEFAGTGFACVHGDFTAPTAFYYVEHEEDARAMFAARTEPLLFVGHTHEPALYVLDAAGGCSRYEPDTFRLEPGERYLVNPGSVGMPRGDDFRASYCILDTATNEVSFKRVVYDTQLFRRKLEQCAGDSAQAAYVLALFDSHALPVLNQRVDFAAASRPAAPAAPRGNPSARVVVRKAAPAKAAAPPAPPKRAPARPLLPALVATLALAAVAAIVAVAVRAHRGAAPQSAVPPEAPPGPEPAPPAAPPAVPAPSAAAPPGRAPRSEPVSKEPAAEGRRWQAVWPKGDPVVFHWNAEGSWNRPGFPDAAGAEAVLPLGRETIRTLDVQLDRDTTVGRLWVTEQFNSSVEWRVGHVLIFDNGAAHAQWFRHKASPAAGALRMTVYTDLRLNSTLEAVWSVQRPLEINNRISGPGGLLVDHCDNDGPANNRQVLIRGGPNTYEGGTTLNGRAGANRRSSFVVEKNQAFGTGDVQLNECADLVLTDRGATDDMIADGATLRLSGVGKAHSTVVLEAGVQETVGGLAFNGVAQAAGSWGSAASAAEHKSDEYFAGPGLLIVAPAKTARP